MTNIKQIGLALVSVCLTSLLAQSIFAVDYKLQLDYETIDQEYLTEKTSDSTSTESYLGLVFENIPRTRKASLYLYPNRQIADFLVKWKQSPTLESSFYLHYDSASEDSNKTKASGQVNIGRRNTFSLKLAKGHALNTFRRGGNNLILEATKQEIHVVKNNTAKTIELGYSSGGFNFAIIVENGANADSAFGGESYELDGFRDIAQSLSQEFRSSIDPSIISELEFYRSTRDQASTDAASFLTLFNAYDIAANQANADISTATNDAAPFVMDFMTNSDASDNAAMNAIVNYNTESSWDMSATAAFNNAAIQLGFSNNFQASSDAIETDSNTLNYKFYRTTADISLGQAGELLHNRARANNVFFAFFDGGIRALSDIYQGTGYNNSDYDDYKNVIDAASVDNFVDSWKTITNNNISLGGSCNGSCYNKAIQVSITSDSFLAYASDLIQFKTLYENIRDASNEVTNDPAFLLFPSELVKDGYLGGASSVTAGGLQNLIASSDVQTLYQYSVLADTSADFYYDIVSSDN